MKKGFTLSEVLITLGIIGVIAALTLPSMIKSYREKVYVAQLKKVYTQVQDAVSNIIADEHADNWNNTTGFVASAAPSTDFPEGKGAYYFLNNYFKTMKTGCNGTDGNANQCYAPNYAAPDNSGYTMTLAGSYCIQTINGAAICLVTNSASSTTTVFVDVNGPDAPNVAGRDAFIFDIIGKRLRDWSTDGAKCATKAAVTYGHIGDYAAGCLTRIMEDGWQMKY